jgi:hypothetical protein
VRVERTSSLLPVLLVRHSYFGRGRSLVDSMGADVTEIERTASCVQSCQLNSDKSYCLRKGHIAPWSSWSTFSLSSG